MKRWLRLAILLPVFAIAAISFALVGWHMQGKRAGDVVFEAVHVVSAGGDYADSTKWPGNFWLEAARWLGLAFFVCTALKAFGLVLARQWAEFAAQLAPRDMVLIGDHPLLDALARLLARHRRVLWLAPERTPRIAGPRVVARGWQAHLVRQFRLRRARAVIIAYAADDLQALDVARAVIASHPQGEVAILSGALTTVEGLKQLSGLDQVRVLSPAQAAIRSLHERYPPFLLAEHATRVHAVLLGCGETGERIIADLLLSSLVVGLDRPLVTIVDPRAAEIRASLRVRAPELEQSVEFGWIEPPSCGDPRALPMEALCAAAATTPFTAIYACLPDDRDSLAAGATIDTMARRHDWPVGAIFVRYRGRSPATMGSRRPDVGRLIPFGSSEQVAEGLGLLGGEPDLGARRLHEGYRAAAASGAAADLPWADLPEDLREANRRVLAHLPAKLASAGVPLDGWLERRRAGDTDAMLPSFPDFEGDPTLLRRLSVLEHDRWMAERRLAGWRWGATRDDTRRLHPDLVPFEQLSERARSYDSDVIRTLAAVLARDSGKPAHAD